MDSVELRNRIAALRARKRNLPGAAGVGSTVLIVALALWGLKSWPGWGMGVLAFFTIGLMQYRLVLAAHEATHKTLFHPVWLNESLGLVVASLVGVSLFNYREAHLKHHKTPQSIQDDIDGYIYRPLLQAPPGWPRLWLLLTGNYRDIITKLRRKFFGDAALPGAPREVAAYRTGPDALLRQLAPLIVAQGLIWSLLAWTLTWWAYFVWWLAPIFVVALQADRARTFLEHGYNYFFPGPVEPDLARAPQDTIDVATNPIERYLFAPFGFSRHQAHHAYLTVPFYHLPELAALLEAHQPGYHRRVRGSYPLILCRMLWAQAA